MVYFTKSQPVYTHRSILNKFIILLKLCGTWNIDSSASIVKFLYRIYKVIVYTILIIFIATLSVDLLRNYNNLLIVTDDGCYLAGISVILFKLYNFNKHHKRIRKLISRVYQILDVLSQQNDTGVQNLLKVTMLFEKIALYFFIILAGFLVIALVIFVPKNDGELPIRASFPFDTTVSPGHEIAFVCQTAAITLGLYCIVAMDSTAINLCRCINAQLVILASNYEKCVTELYNRCKIQRFSSSSKSSNTFSNEKISSDDELIHSFILFTEKDELEGIDSFFKRFETCKVYHQELIDIIDEFNTVFGSSMLMQIFASFSMICLTCFQAVLGTASKKSLVKFIVYFGAAISQLINWCWSGNEIIYQSKALHESQWQSGWEHQLDNQKVKALIIMSMMRTKKPLQLQARNFYSMSMQTLIAILRNSYSFFALLRTITEAV